MSTMQNRPQLTKMENALRGFLKTCRFEQPQLGEFPPANNYFVEAESQLLELQYDSRQLQIVLRLLERYFGDTLDEKIGRQILKEIAHDWIDQKCEVANQEHVAQAWQKLENELSSKIVTCKWYIPVVGLKFTSPTPLELGCCQLWNNADDSAFRAVIKSFIAKYTPSYEAEIEKMANAPSYLTTSLTMHNGRAHVTARTLGEEALDILRLFRGCYYLDVHNRAMPRQMGLYGSLVVHSHRPVFSVLENHNIDETWPGWSINVKNFEPFIVDDRALSAIKTYGLDLVNTCFAQPTPGQASSLQGRLRRAARWFSKATTASSIADSFLMLAIAIESILSEGRTTKETYAERIAGLVTPKDDFGIYPPGLVARQLAGTLKQQNKESRFATIQQRVVELFEIRNRIAHGNLEDDDVNPLDLIDFETIARATILSFVLGGWSSLADFKHWLIANKPT